MKDLRLNKRYGVQFEYLLDCVNSEEIGDDASDKEKIAYVFSCFENEYDNSYTKRLYPNLCDRLENYLRGLPGCINIAFYDYDIIQIGKSWGYCKTPRSEAKFINNWWSVSAFRLLQMRKLLGV